MLQACIRGFVLCCITIVVFPGVVLAVEANNLFIEGQDYIKLPDAMRHKPDAEQLLMADPHKVQVLFFFSYACHGCQILHHPFDTWAIKQRKASKNKVAIYVYPVSFNPQWAMLSKMYYVMQSLDPQGKLNDTIFKAVQKQGLRLWDEAIMKKFFVQHGYTEAEVNQAYNSFSVNRLVKRADDISKAYSIVATPDVVINGPMHSYKLDLSKAGNNIDRVFKILDYLVARELQLLPR